MDGCSQSMSVSQPAPAESALSNVRAEWVPSTFDSDGTPRVPTDPSWNRFSDYIESFPGWGGDAQVEGEPPTGQVDPSDHFRGPEEHDLSIQYWLQRFFVDTDGNANDAIGELINYDGNSAAPVHEILIRQEVTDGGADGAGFRTYVYGSGGYPTSADVPGDPSASNPIMAEAGYACEKVRQYVIHQPADGTTLDLVSTSPNDTMDVTIESEDASTTDTVTLNGTTSVTTTQSFPDIDAIWLSSEPEGDISVKDDAGKDLLEDPITGSATDGVEGDRGIPLLGSGSHASAIGTPPENYLFLGTTSTYDGGALAESAAADRVHALDLSIEVDSSREPRQGTRRQSIDIGTRTVSVEGDLAGPYESAKQNYRYYTGKEADLVYGYPDGDVTLVSAQLTDTDDVDFEGGDANLLYGVTWEPHGSPAITATHN